MQTFPTTIASSQPALRRELALSASVAAGLTYWLPLIIIGLAVLAVDHSLRYSLPSNWEKGGGVDLVAEAGGSNPIRQFSFIAIGSTGALLLLMRSRTPLAVNKWLLLLVVLLGTLIAVSPAWADDPVQSLKRVMIPLLTLIAALGAAKHWQARQLCQFAVLLSSMLLLVGVLAACAAGAILPTDDLRFAGTLHPNTQSINCAALCLASLALFLQPGHADAGRRSWFWLFPFFVGVTFLLLTRSRTATAALLAGCLMLLILGVTPRLRTLIVGSLAFVACALGVLLLDVDSDGGFLLDLVRMGRAQDTHEIASFTGRIPIWQQALSDIAERPLLGYGYGGFWTPQQVWTYLKIVDWEIVHSHSAYVETMLNLGIVGLTLGLTVLVSAIWLAIRRYRSTENIGYAFIAALLVFAMVHGCLDANFVAELFAALLAMICVSFLVLHGRSTAEGELAVTPKLMHR